MNRLTDNKIVLVTRPTRLAELVIRFNTVSQAKFYVEHQGRTSRTTSARTRLIIVR
jgi:hypothetical protein